MGLPCLFLKLASSFSGFCSICDIIFALEVHLWLGGGAPARGMLCARYRKTEKIKGFREEEWLGCREEIAMGSGSTTLLSPLVELCLCFLFFLLFCFAKGALLFL